MLIVLDNLGLRHCSAERAPSTRPSETRENGRAPRASSRAVPVGTAPRTSRLLASAKSLSGSVRAAPHRSASDATAAPVEDDEAARTSSGRLRAPCRCRGSPDARLRAYPRRLRTDRALRASTSAAAMWSASPSLTGAAQGLVERVRGARVVAGVERAPARGCRPHLSTSSESPSSRRSSTASSYAFERAVV